MLKRKQGTITYKKEGKVEKIMPSSDQELPPSLTNRPYLIRGHYEGMELENHDNSSLV